MHEAPSAPLDDDRELHDAPVLRRVRSRRTDEAPTRLRRPAAPDRRQDCTPDLAGSWTCHPWRIARCRRRAGAGHRASELPLRSLTATTVSTRPNRVSFTSRRRALKTAAGGGLSSRNTRTAQTVSNRLEIGPVVHDRDATAHVGRSWTSRLLETHFREAVRNRRHPGWRSNGSRPPTKGDPMRIRIPSPATVIASLALLLSLTGTAVAAGTDHRRPDPEQHGRQPRPDEQPRQERRPRQTTGSRAST